MNTFDRKLWRCWSVNSWENNQGKWTLEASRLIESASTGRRGMVTVVANTAGYFIKPGIACDRKEIFTTNQNEAFEVCSNLALGEYFWVSQ